MSAVGNEDKESSKSLPWVMRTRNPTSVVGIKNKLKKVFLGREDKESSKCLPWLMRTRNPAKLCLGYENKESSKSSPWLMWTRYPAKVYLENCGQSVGGGTLQATNQIAR